MSFTRAQQIGQARKSTLDFSEDEISMTEQQHAEACDIHNIMHKSRLTGLTEHISAYQGQYMDMPSGLDFKTAQDAIAAAKSMFETVPARIRAKFGNDPAAYVDFMQDAKNYTAIEEMGLDPSHLPKPKAPPEPTKPVEPQSPPD